MCLQLYYPAILFIYFILRRQRKYSQLVEYYRLKEEKKMT